MEVNGTVEKFWSGKRVLITGHTGFKGSWLTLWLQKMDAEVRGISLDAAKPKNMFDVCNIAKNVDHQIADIRDFDLTLKLIQDFQPEIIFHMAAQPLVRLSYSQPIHTYSTNIMGTVHVMEAALRAKSVKSFVNVTTDKCYANKDLEVSFKEDEPMGGYDPYSSSKGCSELITTAYRKSFYEKAGIPIATARAGNVIGGGDWAMDRLVPDVLRAFQKNQSVNIRNPNSVRPWQHVLEPLSGYLLLAERLYNGGEEYSGSWNFGPKEGDHNCVHWIIKQLCELWESEIEQLIVEQGDLYENNYLMLDITKAKDRLGWEPIWPLKTALKKVVEWHKAYENGVEMKALSIEQITTYHSDAFNVGRFFSLSGSMPN